MGGLRVRRSGGRWRGAAHRLPVRRPATRSSPIPAITSTLGWWCCSRLVPWAGADRISLLFTSVGRCAAAGVRSRFLDNEPGISGDANCFADLFGVMNSLSVAGRYTGGHRRASSRWREIMAPIGMGDEARSRFGSTARPGATCASTAAVPSGSARPRWRRSVGSGPMPARRCAGWRSPPRTPVSTGPWHRSPWCSSRMASWSPSAAPSRRSPAAPSRSAGLRPSRSPPSFGASKPSRRASGAPRRPASGP